MRVLLLLGLCALAYSGLPNPEWLTEIQPEINHQDYEFQPNREYRYNYNGQLATGTPGVSKQHSATRIQAVVSVLFKTERQVLMKLTHIRMGRLNQHIPNPKAMIPFMAFEQVPIEPELLTKLHAPVKFIYDNGLIKDVIFDGIEEPWSANIKRGVMNMLQIDIKAKARNDRELSEPIRTPEQDFFSTVENTLEGECETFYTVLNEPCYDRMRCGQHANRQVLNVTKSINFERCNRRPEIKYNFRFQDYCPSCDKKYQEPEKLLQSSTIMKFNISGTRDRFLIETVNVESQHSFVPFNEDKNIITSYINQTLELLTAGPIETQIPEPSQPISSDSDMIYTPDWDILKEQFFQKGEQEFLDETPYTEINNKVRFVSQILRRLVEQMPSHEVKPDAPRQFARLVKVFRILKKQELNQIMRTFHQSLTESFTPEQYKIIKDLLVDALSVCGTVDCTKELVEEIKQQRISPLKATFSLKNLVSVRVASKEIVDEILSLCESERALCERSPILKQSVYLTAGSILNSLCTETPDKWAEDFKTTPSQQKTSRCPRPIKDRYVQLFINNFERTNNWYEKVLFLNSLGNSGIDVAVHELEKLIKNVDGEHTPLIRKAAIMAMRQMRETMPRKIQKVLMPIYMNRWEIPSVRIAAVYQVLQTQPEKAILDQIAKKLFTERSRQVASFIFSYSHTLANSTDPCEKRLADDLKMSLRHARGLPIYQIMESWLVHNSFYNEKMKAGFSLELAHIMNNYSSIPTVLGAAIHGNYFGFWQRNLLSVIVGQEGADKFVRQYLDQSIFHDSSLVELVNRRSPRSVMSSDNELKNIFRRLNIRNRRMEESMEPKAFAAIKVKDQDVVILPVSVATMPLELLSLFSSGKFNIGPLSSYLAQGINFNVNSASFIQDVTRKVPTSLGLPIVLNVKIPTVARAIGSLKVDMSNPWNKVKVLADVKPSIVSTMVVKMESWSPIVNSGLKVLNQARFNLPIRANFEMEDIAQGKPKVSLSLKVITRKNDLLTLEARPITLTRVWPKTMQIWQEPEEKTVPCEELKKISTSDKSFGEKVIGIKYRLRTDFRDSAMKYKVKITHEPGMNPPNEVVLKVSTESWGEMLDGVIRPQFDQSAEQLINAECDYTCGQCEACEPCRECKSEQYQQIKRKSIQYYKDYTTDKSEKTQMKIELFTIGSSTERKLQIMAKKRCDPEQRFCQASIDLQRTPVPSLESQPWKMECRAQCLYPQTPFSLTELSSMAQKYLKSVKCQWGYNEQDKQTKFVDLIIKAQKSWEQRKLLDNDRETEYCRQCQMKPECQQQIEMFESQPQNQECAQCKAYCSPVSVYDQISKWADLCEIDVVAKYQNVHPYVQNITNKLYRSLKYTFYPESDVSQIRIRNQENTIKAKITIEPKTHKYVNITVRTPQENAKFTNIEAKMPLPVPNPKRGLTSRYVTSNPFVRYFTANPESQSRLYQQPICKVSSARIETFDGVQYRAPITSCYTVLAKDCSDNENSIFAVLMKKLSPESQLKKIKILTKLHRIEVEPIIGSGSQLKVTVNGQEKLRTSVRPTSPYTSQSLSSLEESTEQTSSGEYEPFSSQQKLDELIEHGHVVVKIEKIGPYLKFVLPEAGIKVYFDGYSANIKMSQLHKSSQCGLCGQYDMETSNEFYTADNQEPSSWSQFYNSYLLKDQQECQLTDQEQLRIQNQDQYTPKWSWQWNTQSDSSEQLLTQDSQESTESLESMQPIFTSNYNLQNQDYYSYNQQIQNRISGQQQPLIYKTKVIEHGHEICFSKRPIEQCPHHSYPTELKPARTVVYCCKQRTDSLTEVMHQKALRGDRMPELDSLPASFTKQEQLPQTCVTL